MNNNEAIQSLIDGIMICVDNKIDNASYDKTETARIIGINLDGTYKISLSGFTYDNVYSNGSCFLNEMVKVKIPLNNYNSMYINKSSTSGGGSVGDVSWNDITNKPNGLVVDNDYNHTDNNFTDNDKDKIDNLSEVALSGDYNDLTDKPNIPSIDGLATTTYVDNSLSEKVDKVIGKELSENDFTDSLLLKLNNIEDNAQANVQSDWNVSDSSLDSYINNKPTNLSDFSNDENFIINTVNNLTNYYTKSLTYTKTEVNNLISSIPNFSIEIVVSLPTTDISTTTIYLVLKADSEDNDYYDEYIYIDSQWEIIGNTKIDLSNYYTVSEVNILLDEKVDKVDGKVLSDNNYTDTEKTKLNGIESEANKTIVDDELSDTSENPVQNKIINNSLNGKANTSGTYSNLNVGNATTINNKTVDDNLTSVDNLWTAQKIRDEIDNSSSGSQTSIIQYRGTVDVNEIIDITIPTFEDNKTVGIEVLVLRNSIYECAIHGIDYNYSYPNNETVRVTFFNAGSYIANYGFYNIGDYSIIWEE